MGQITRTVSNLSAFVRSRSTWPWFLFLFCIHFVTHQRLYNFEPRLLEPVPPLDLKFFGYDYDYVLQLFQHYQNTTGDNFLLHQYQRMYTGLYDVANPFVLALLQVWLISKLFGGAVNLVPFVWFSIDMLVENVANYNLVQLYLDGAFDRETTKYWIIYGNIGTVLKGPFFFTSCGLVLFGLLRKVVTLVNRQLAPNVERAKRM
eukprot:TRINITY_DN11678_c0_g1_i1.p1 TRINITY_DN11678_c0_g1~~TRINITY_DN11678_c0_g1_i1.p1  ORF type:complete len:204 (+),score=8.46 TRINITY_DN11678_c0_g1_i1:104-715(+)